MQSDVRRTRRQPATCKNGRLRVQPVPGLRAWEMAKCACPPRPVMRSRVFQPPAASAFSRFLAAPFCGRGKAALFSAGRPNLPSLSNLPENPPPVNLTGASFHADYKLFHAKTDPEGSVVCTVIRSCAGGRPQSGRTRSSAPASCRSPAPPIRADRPPDGSRS